MDSLLNFQEIATFFSHFELADELLETCLCNF